MYIVVVFSAFCYFLSSVSSDPTLDVDRSHVVFTTSDRYLSLGLDSNLIRHRWQTFDFSSDRLVTLARGLSPAYLRLAGTDGDRMIFNESDAANGLFPPTNFTMSVADWDDINTFAAKVNWRIMFGLNAQLRDPTDDSWDPNNALDLLRYSMVKGYAGNLDFELGNEPDLYFTEQYLTILTGRQLAADYNRLYRILRSDLAPYFNASVLRGPAIAKVGILSAPLLLDFLDHVGPLDAVTWHHYYGGSELRYLANYTDPRLLDTYAKQCRLVRRLVQQSRRPDLKIWQGETSSTYSPPGGSIDESYAAGFMLLDKLGLSALCGSEVVIRQTFFGFWFALVDGDLKPTPNYWLALLYRQLVGTNVLDLQSDDDEPVRSVRLYANCLSISSRVSSKLRPGGVVVYGMNLISSDVRLNFQKLGDVVDEFIFTPDKNDLLSRDIRLNGQLLTMPNDTTLPELRPRRTADPQRVLFPAKTLAFFVIQDVKLC